MEGTFRFNVLNFVQFCHYVDQILLKVPRWDEDCVLFPEGGGRWSGWLVPWLQRDKLWEEPSESVRLWVEEILYA